MKKLRLIVEDTEERKLNRAETFNALSNIHPDVWAQYSMARNNSDKGNGARQALGFEANKIPNMKELHQHFLENHKIPINIETFRRWTFSPKSGQQHNSWLKPPQAKIDRAARLVDQGFSVAGASKVVGIGNTVLANHVPEIKSKIRPYERHDDHVINTIVKMRTQGHGPTTIRQHLESQGITMTRGQMSGLLSRNFDGPHLNAGKPKRPKRKLPQPVNTNDDNKIRKMLGRIKKLDKKERPFNSSHLGTNKPSTK